MSERMGTPCKPTDSIKCVRCGNICAVQDLQKSLGHRFPKAEKTGASWQSMYYCCPCDLEHPLVYDPGDEQLVVVPLSKAELIPTERIRVHA